MKRLITAISVASAVLASPVSFSADSHWAYSGHEGPERWGELADEFAICSSGKNQSPINLTGMIEGELPTLNVNYKVGGNEVINNGHTIQVNYAPGSTMTVGKRTFELKQFHFHTPSENTIEGHSYPMEVHFVHADESGNLAVIGVMFKVGEHNAELEKAWQQMPQQSGGKETLDSVVNASALLPHNNDYYRFNGSLTTPPCSEGVNWFVMKYFDTASEEQIQKFVDTMHEENNRPVQPLNSRIIIQ